MRQAKIASHYGGPIFVDQCRECGGIWFDESELFRAKQGEAEKIEAVNAEILRTPSTIESSRLTCPRDNAAMHRFTDKYFPQDIVFVRCPSCRGIWLNRGIFTRYQQFRRQLMRPKKRSPQDERLEEGVARLLASYENKGSTETLIRLGEFLSTPVSVGYRPYVGEAGDADSIAGAAFAALLAILRLFIFKS